MSTPQSVVNMLKWQDDHAGDLAYSQSDPHRLSSDDAHMLSPTDCSGLIARLHSRFADGLYIGTYTGNESEHGTLITTDHSRVTSLAEPGDCILYNWYYDPDGPFNHINMYAGGGVVWNHGGPGHGPVKESLASNLSGARHVMMRRFVQPAPPPKPVYLHSKSKDNPLNGHQMPWFLKGKDYIGVYWGPNESHGGAYASEQPVILLLKQFLHWKYPNAPINTKDGRFGSNARDAVTKFQKQYMPHTEFFGQVWADDWAKMASL
jgi:hypothetical protein